MGNILNTAEVAAYVNVHLQTVERWRNQGCGPAFSKIAGGRIVYTKEAVDAWLAQEKAPLKGGVKMLSAKEAARFLGVHYRTLSNWRVAGTGPRYLKFGSTKQNGVRYREADLAEWHNARLSKEKKPMQHDRDDYRCMSTARLIEEGKNNPNNELCIALAERLNGERKFI